MKITFANPNNTPSRKVNLDTDRELVISTAKDLLQILFTENAIRQAHGRVALALHHAQVAKPSLSLFVCLPGAMGDDVVVINPKILEKFEKQEMMEGCMSFPLRSDKKVLRYGRVVVEYYTLDKDDKFIKRNVTLPITSSQVFQHEVDHGHGRHIYQK